MTPFGRKVRELRRIKGASQKDMAAAMNVSPAYLSALEHGHRGRPSWAMVQKVIGYFNIIWDEADEMERLAQTSLPRVVIDTSNLSPNAAELVNLLSQAISQLDESDIQELALRLKVALGRSQNSQHDPQNIDRLLDENMPKSKAK